MSQTANTFSTPDNNGVGNLNGLFKETYADKLKELIPDGVKLMNMIKFMPKDKQPGNLYNQPVILGAEHGVTFASSEEDAFNLMPPVAGAIKNATVRGNPILLRSVLGYTAASRAQQGGKQAFMDGTKYLVANMLRSITKALEIELLYGQMGYGVVASSLTTAVTIQTAEWAPGIWAGSQQMPIEIRNAAGSTVRGQFNIVSVDMDTRVLTLNADAAAAGVVNTDIIWHKSAFGNEFAGIHKIVTNTGTIFGIDASQYALWRGNTYSAGSAALTFAKLQKSVSRGVEKGLDSKVLVLCSVRAWADLLTDQAALRQFDQSYSPTEVKNGAKSIMFYSQNGDMEVQPSIYVKEGFAYVLDMETFSRVGSSDVTFKRPGLQGDTFFRDLTDAAGLELRLWSDQALFCDAPGRNTLISQIVNVA